MANRARGGGCECPEYYPECEIRFMNLANIHAVRKSFHLLRQLCASPPDLPKYVLSKYHVNLFSLFLIINLIFHLAGTVYWKTHDGYII